MKKTVLREYAKLIVRCGVNVQKGQEVVINADLDQPEFVQMVVEEAYKAKAKRVTVEWNYQPLAKVHVRYKTVKTIDCDRPNKSQLLSKKSARLSSLFVKYATSSTVAFTSVSLP